ncbi:GTPase-activating protein GYP2 [Diplonema papillatum]|nr:GTPase-activating protein GYP2 [Diplonema papillatum]
MATEKCVDCVSLACFGSAQWDVLQGDDAVRMVIGDNSRKTAFRALCSKDDWLDRPELRDPCLRLVLHGIPKSMRQSLWPQFLGVEKVKATYSAELWERVRCGHGVQQETLSLIERDVTRTFPQHPLFKTGDGPQLLTRVLVAYASFDPKLGYTQGMAFTAGLLILSGMGEEDSFWCMVSLSLGEKWGMRGVWAPELETHVWAQIRSDLWAELAMKVPAYVDRMQADREAADMVLLPFLPSLFCSRLPLKESEKVFDAFVLVGWPALLSVLTTTIARAWRAVSLQGQYQTTHTTVAALLPFIYADCKNNAPDILVASWWALLPADSNGTDFGPPCQVLSCETD